MRLDWIIIVRSLVQSQPGPPCYQLLMMLSLFQIRFVAHIGVYCSLIDLFSLPFNTTHFIFIYKYISLESTVSFWLDVFLIIYLSFPANLRLLSIKLSELFFLVTINISWNIIFCFACRICENMHILNNIILAPNNPTYRTIVNNVCLHVI